MDFTGTWHILEVEGLDGDYLNMDVFPYIKIRPSMLGNFQFGLVSGAIDGKIVDYNGEESFEFTWEGNDENDPVSGSGWIKLKDKDLLEGEFRFHLSDDWMFQAKRVK